MHTALADALVAEGVEVVFGLMGDANMELVVDLVEQHGVRFVPVRHEQTAVFAADAYARASGRVGVATVTQGPGLANCATALTVARHAGSPVVLVAGDTPVGNRLNVQSFEQRPFVESTAGAFQPVRLLATLAEDVWLAFRHVRLGRGPVVLDVGMDLQAGPRPGYWTYLPSAETLPTPQRRLPDPERLELVGKLVEGARRPVVLGGRGAHLAGAEQALVVLAERLGAPLVTSLGGAGLFAGHRRLLGVMGGFATPSTSDLLEDADLVLAFGAGLNQFTLKTRTPLEATVVQVGLDEGAVGDVRPADEAVLGDARLTAEALLDLVPVRRDGWADDRLGARDVDPFAGVEMVIDPDGVDPRAVVRACNGLLPPDRDVVIGIGHFGGFFGPHLQVHQPGSLFTPWEFGSIGVAVPFGLGVAFARPDRLTVAVEGDGSLMQCLGDLDTLVRCEVPLLVLVMDDRAYGAEIHKLRRLGIPDGLAHFTNPDFAAVAHDLGLDAHTVRRQEDLDEVFPRLRDLRRPTLVHVHVTQQVTQQVF